MDDKFRMKREFELKEGLYFVHGYYLSGWRENDIKELYRDQMILMQDSMDDIYDIDAYDINLREMRMENQIMIPEGEFVYYDGREFQTAEDNPTSVVHTELNKQLIRTIGFQNYGNQPKEVNEDISDVCSYHINVGHGNCSIIVFCENGSYNMWMVDCSVFDFTNKHNYSSNLEDCLQSIFNKFGIARISKLMITHLHYDHINGIEYLIKRGWIDANTEVWMNIQYPWKQPTYNRILLQLSALGVKFIDPIIGNSTKNIHILYPDVSFNKKTRHQRTISIMHLFYIRYVLGKIVCYLQEILRRKVGRMYQLVCPIYVKQRITVYHITVVLQDIFEVIVCQQIVILQHLQTVPN